MRRGPAYSWRVTARFFVRIDALFYAALLTASGVRAEAADAPERAKARDLGYAGVEAYQKGDYSGANARFEQAYALLPAPTLGLWSARALDKLGKLREAAARYEAVARLPVSSGNAEVQQQARVDAERELTALTVRLPRVRFSAQGGELTDVQLAVDAQPVPSGERGEGLALNPGSHRVVAVRGGQRLELTITLSERERRDVVLNFTRVAASARGSAVDASRPEPRRTLGWVSVGVGGAGLVFGTVTGLWALGKHGALEDSGHCQDTHCSPEERDRVSTYNTLRVLSTVGFVVGGTSAATGLILSLSAKKSRAPAGSAAGNSGVVLALTGSGAELLGRF